MLTGVLQLSDRRKPFRETGAVFFLNSIVDIEPIRSRPDYCFTPSRRQKWHQLLNSVTFAYDETEYLWLIMIDDGPGDSVKQ